MLCYVIRFFKKIRCVHDGNVLVEFAFIAPIMLTMIISLFQLSRTIQVRTKMAEVGSFLGEHVTAQALKSTQIQDLTQKALRNFAPLKSEDAQIIMSCLYHHPTNGLHVAWQVSKKGSDIAEQTSHIGAEGDTPTLPTDLNIDSPQTLISIEIFFDFKPVIESPYFGPLQRRIFRTTSFHVPCDGRMNAPES